MGWNDHYDPSEYDPDDPDSMIRLAIRASRDHAATQPPAPPLDPADPGVNECWDCGRLHRSVKGDKGLCGPCWIADNY